MRGRTKADSWELEPSLVTDFLAVVARHIPEAHTASFEIRGACAEAQEVYAQYRSPIKYSPIRDTIFPRTQLYYSVISEDLSKALEGVLRGHEPAKVFWHIKGFDDRHMLFALHDADTGGLVCFSPKVDSKRIHKITAALCCNAEKIETRYDWEKDCRQWVKR